MKNYFLFSSMGGLGFSYLYLRIKDYRNNGKSKLLNSGNFVKHYGELINNGLYFGLLFGLLRAYVDQHLITYFFKNNGS